MIITEFKDYCENCPEIEVASETATDCTETFYGGKSHETTTRIYCKNCVKCEEIYNAAEKNVMRRLEESKKDL